LEELVKLLRSFYSLLLNKALYLSLKVKKERRGPERYEHAVIEETGQAGSLYIPLV
jgi:hypothetical protein